MDGPADVPSDLDLDRLALPEGTRLVHIGPPKTGTTALQAAFHLARDTAREQGVHYAGFGRHSSTEIRAVVGLRSPWSDEREPPPIRYWNRLASEIRSSSARCVVLSGEDLAVADEAAIRRVAGDIGAPVHVVATLRPVARLLPSQWQQYVQNRLVQDFDTWLRETLGGEREGRSKDFWRRHRHDEIVGRWAGVVGPENVTAIVLDESEPDRLYRAFEALTGLRPGTLVPGPTLTNRSLTLPEIEAVRAFNVAYRSESLPKPLYTRVMRRGAAPLMERRQPHPDEPPVALPTWSLEAIAAASRQIVDGLRATGVRVVGDLERLAEVSSATSEPAADVRIPPDIAATMAMGVLVATGAARGSAPLSGDDDGAMTPELERPYSEAPELFRISTPHLTLALVRRVRAGIAHSLRRVPGRIASQLTGRPRGSGGARRGGSR